MWYIPEYIDPHSVDTTWRPDTDEPCVYHFLSQHINTDSGVISVGVSGVTYTVGSGTEMKIVHLPRVQAVPLMDRWTVPQHVDVNSIDFTWHPNAFDPPYIYHFPSQHGKSSGVTYTVPGATRQKLLASPTVQAIELRERWAVPDYIDKGSIDFTWHPDGQDDFPYVHHFPSQHKDTASKKASVGVSGVTYTEPGATVIKIVHDHEVRSSGNRRYWIVPDYIDETTIDFTWHPNAFEPPYIYHFPSQHHASSGVIYSVPGATAIKFVDPFTVKSCAQMHEWIVPDYVDKSKFDFSWHPPGDRANYQYYFPTQWQRSGGPVYKGTAGDKFCDDQKAVALPDRSKWLVPGNIDVDSFDFSWHPDSLSPDYEYHFPTQWQRSGGPVYSGSAGTKCVSQQVALAIPDMTKWTVPANADVSDFDFSWHPDVFEKDYAYYFPTQHQREGGPIYNKDGQDGIKYTTAQKIRVEATQIFYMDFLNPESAEQLAWLKERWPYVKSTRYVDNHLNVLKRVVAQAETEYIWVISSIADYSGFDFTWHPEAYQNEMIHVFPAGDQLRGDTFYINVRSFKTQMIDLDMLDWFNVICYHKEFSVPRFYPETVYYEGDDLISVIKNHSFKSPYSVFSNLPNVHVINDQCLWSAKDRKADWCSHSKGVTLAPREIKLHLRTQIYDYPYLEKPDQPRNVYVDEPLDIVYISNGEPDAERWYDHLCDIMDREQGQSPYLIHKNTVTRVKNVNGRTAAYQAAARASTTPWFFAVFAKLEVDANFDWGWQPDMWQGPKHYIFNSRNPVNGLEYGHMGMIAYNKDLVLINDGQGLDFTLNQPHESVPVLSGIAHYDQDAWTTWRTAFREVAKLKYFNSVASSVETDYRLKIWCSQAKGEFAEWSLLGAQDAVKYFDSVNGDYTELMKTYEWDWLRKYFDNKY